MELRSLRFVCEPIDVQFDAPPDLEKKPGCPQRLTWRDRTFQITDLLREWHDFRRRGRMARNMRPEHAATAERIGSWGVGRYHFVVRTDTGQIFDLCYDRAPKGTTERKGRWFLIQEMMV